MPTIQCLLPIPMSADGKSPEGLIAWWPSGLFLSAGMGMGNKHWMVGMILKIKASNHTCRSIIETLSTYDCDLYKDMSCRKCLKRFLYLFLLPASVKSGSASIETKTIIYYMVTYQHFYQLLIVLVWWWIWGDFAEQRISCVFLVFCATAIARNMKILWRGKLHALIWLETALMGLISLVTYIKGKMSQKLPSFLKCITDGEKDTIAICILEQEVQMINGKPTKATVFAPSPIMSGLRVKID